YRLRVEPNAGIAIGNVSTFAGVGGTMTFGPNQKQLQDTPPRLPPAMAGTGYFDTPQNRDWDWYLFTGLNGRIVARDIFLDGNSFRDSAAIDKKRFVMDANAGAAITYGDTRLAYTLIYRTKEFYGQSDPAIFGSLSLTRRF
ncbi:MAG: lipid A-modifier LpxR family protein, partial [Pseudomonadota bacterium]